ncbi:MAG TPA: ATP-binding protein [Caldilineaceae bacterium]|nr:ATP-binding protein [Caldilineaceae bacterium]
MISRVLTERLPQSDARRLVMITGARQTGKTTLARTLYPNLRYISLDEVEARLQLQAMPTRAWATAVGHAILDEAQKEPAIFDKLKFAYDDGAIDFSVLLGSSQILMMNRVRETLAGRVFIYELWPLMLTELLAGSTSVAQPLFAHLLQADRDADSLFGEVPPILLGDEAWQRKQWFDYALQWGGMPGLLPLTDDERRQWLGSYTNTYLERDLTDIARLDDLLPYRRFMRLAALRSGQLLSYADLARDADVSPTTARNYLNYLQLSFQAYLLPPYFTNAVKRLVKAPKLYWIDLGLWRHQTNYWGDVTGQLLETYVVGEAIKWIKTTGSTAEAWFYRTHGGLEVDLLITTARGVWGIEVKASPQVKLAQANSLQRLAQEFGDQWRGGIVTYMGTKIEQLAPALWAVPVQRLFSK